MTSTPTAALILAYHRVAGGRDPLMRGVHPERFAAQVGRLAGLADVVPLADITGLRRGLRVALTFDDGYADNWHVAAPILRAAGLPATFCVGPRNLDSPEEHWWDRLEHLLLDDAEAAAGPAALEVEVEGRRVRIDIRTPAGRQRALTVLHRRLLGQAPESVATVLEAVDAQLGSGAVEPCGAHRLLTRDEVAALGRDPLFEVGCLGMTSTGSQLASGDAGDEEELQSAKDVLEGAVGQPVRTFAYPHGAAVRVDRKMVRAVRRVGFDRGVTSTPGLVGRLADRFRLPRFAVHDWPADELERRVKEWVAA